MNGFKTDLCLKEIGEKDGRTVFELLKNLMYLDKKGILIIVPKCFQTDLASVPRLPLVWLAWGDRAHRSGVLHDYLYRINSDPVVSRSLADYYLKESIISTGASSWKVAYPMWAGVRIGGFMAYHAKFVEDSIL